MDWLIHLDYALFHLVNLTLAHPWLDGFFPLITDLHKQPGFNFVAYPLLCFFYFKKFHKKGILFFVMGVFSVLISDWSGSKILKDTVDRKRPFETQEVKAVQRSPARGKSFISNHASNMFSFATYTSSFFPQARIALFTVAGLVAYSRVYNGVHFPLDVLCGAMWGTSVSLIFLLLSYWLANRFFAAREADSK